ncbi:putative E3 ubiquitin-protein ligase LIN-1 [Ricinus communis]|uniref:putative E3 ubiquitin-protein ligase LIN-1 n=1 Tax=Ricinus communis TaxID=3988 RepID=UPI00201A8DE8|nr:putative E3 ubiquitin-protein ligase LIN-1 [Ricinus communis]
MSRCPMASSSSFSCSPLSHDYERPGLESVKSLVISVNEYCFELLANGELWNALKSLCISKLNIRNQEFFEFSEHSVVSNLYWGIESVEAAVRAKCVEEKANRLKSSERMLQAPALLDEHGVTAGIQNHYLVCCSYFYLSMIRKLQNDEWQVALHFLQAMLVSPRFVRAELAPEFCASLFPVSGVLEVETMCGKKGKESVTDFLNEANINDAIREIARRYKHWLTYYQVMLYGETPQWHCRSSYNDESQDFWQVSNSSDSSELIEQERCSQTYKHEKVHPLDSKAYPANDKADKPKTCREIQEIGHDSEALNHFNQSLELKIRTTKQENYTSIKRLQEVLMDSQSDTPTSVNSCCSYYLEEVDAEVKMADNNCSIRNAGEDDLQPEVCAQTLQAACLTLDEMCRMVLLSSTTQEVQEVSEVKISSISSSRYPSSTCDFDLSILELRNKKFNVLDCDSAQRPLWQHQAQVTNEEATAALQNGMLAEIDRSRRAIRGKQNLHSQKNLNELYLNSGKDPNTELMAILEKAISRLCFSEGLAKCEEDYAVEVTAIYELLNSKKGIKYTILKDIILDQLLTAISSSKEETVVRASMSILTTIVSVNKSAVEDIKKKGLRLCDLANALKRNVHEAAILIYLINPPLTEIKTLELLPALMEILCTSNSYKEKPASPLITPPAASLMIIEVLVTAFDRATNNVHLAAINSPRVLSRLLDVARDHNLEECISMTNILIKCMQFDGQCRKYISQLTRLAPFKRLLQSNEKHAKFTALQFFHELLYMPRSSAISLLQRIGKEGSNDIMPSLMQCLQQLQPDYQLLAANLLLQLDTLEQSSGKNMYREEAMQIILKSVASEENSALQQLSTFILANIGGTYTWTGEPYTVALLVKKAGLTSLYHRTMIRNVDWSDPSLQDAGIDSWCSKIAKGIISIGKPAFQALESGLRSNTKRVSRDSLTAIAWIGCEIAKYPNSLRNSACEILLNGVEQFLHPGSELEERLLACLCIYNYTSGRGMQKLIHFSEGVRESLRRFSGVTWMAEELHRVAEFYLPNNSRISCVHTQVLETKHDRSGAVTALIYFRGQLYSGYSDGSIKVWDIKHQSATLVWDLKEHKKAVTCFSLFELGERLLSGSADKTIRVWQMVNRKLECVEVIAMKEPIQKIETYGQTMFIITQGHGMKVLDSSRTVKDLCKNKKFKCMSAVQGKLYIGCTDSSIQELTMTNNREREIKPPMKSWMMQNKPINSIALHKDWLYSASSIVEGSRVKELRTHSKPQMSIAPDKGRYILALGVVEDFIYLNCSSSTSTLQIWLRGTQQNVGRISAGSKITSLLTANDTVLCGTEKGLIKGWIPL